MKTMKSSIAAFFLAGICLPPTAFAEDAKPAAPAKSYPLDTCVVSDEKLGSMGNAFVHQHEGREVRFCCKGCLKDFKKDSAKYLKRLDAAEKAAKK